MKKHLAISLVSVFLVLTIVSSVIIFKPSTGMAAATGVLKVHMLATDDNPNDCFIVELPNGERMVIDNQNSSDLTSKLNSLGIGSIKYLVGTHQHGDHIGGFNNFLNSGFTINNTQIYYPKGAINTTSTDYDYMVTAAANRGLTVKKLVQNDYILNTTVDGKTLTVRVLAPIESKIDGIGTDDYGDVNDSSMVIRVKYGSKAIIFMGDTRSEVEQDLINTVPDLLWAQILKVGHHSIAHNDTWGASDAFLDAVSPTKALITNGPHDVGLPVVTNLQERSIEYWSTGHYGVLSGDVTFTTDGTNNWTTTSTPYWTTTTTGTQYYFLDHNGSGKRMNNNQETSGDDVGMAGSVWSGYNLRWELIDAGNGYYYIENMASGKRLYSKTDGSDVYVVPNTDTSDNVKWKLVDADTTWKFIDNAASGMRLNSDPNINNWMPRLTDPQDTGVNVQWKLTAVPFGS